MASPPLAVLASRHTRFLLRARYSTPSVAAKDIVEGVVCVVVRRGFREGPQMKPETKPHHNPTFTPTLQSYYTWHDAATMSAAHVQIVPGLDRDARLPSRGRCSLKRRQVCVRAVPVTVPKPSQHLETFVTGTNVGAASRDDAVPSRSAKNIPLLDLNQTDQECAAVVTHALFHGVGFFHVVNHGIAPALFDALVASAGEFFDNPFHEKMNLKVGDMKLSRGYEVSPEHLAVISVEDGGGVEVVTATGGNGVRTVSPADETRDVEPSAEQRIVGERFSMGPFSKNEMNDASDNYHTGEDGSLFFAPNVWPTSNADSEGTAHSNKVLKSSMESYYLEMEVLSIRLLAIIATAAGAPRDFFHKKSDKHVSNLQVANYPTLRSRVWGDDAATQIPPRKKAHADSGTITVLARGVGLKPVTGAESGVDTSSDDDDHVSCSKTRNTKAGGLQVLDGSTNEWVDVPVLPGGTEDGIGGQALLVNIGNQLQRWSDDHWVSTKHRVLNPPVSDSDSSTRRTSIAFFHKANYDALIDPREFLRFGGFATTAVSGNNPAVAAGDLSRVGLLRKFAKEGMTNEECSAMYHTQMMGITAAKEASGGFTAKSSDAFWKKSKSRTTSSVECFCLPNDDLGLDRGSSDDGAGLGNESPQTSCPVCRGTGWKPCGQCDGTGKNQEDLYGGKFLKGDRCWLCDGKAKTMCGNCIDMTDTF